MQYTTKVEILTSNKMVQSIKGIVGRKRVDVSVKKGIYIINGYKIDSHLCKKTHN